MARDAIINGLFMPNDSAKETACRLCGGLSVEPFKKDLWQCLDCGFCFIPVSPEAEARIVVNYSQDKVSSSKYYQQTAAFDRKNFLGKLRALERFLKPGIMVDIGGNVGTFARVAKDQGWQVVVFEPNPEAARFAKNLGIKTINDFFSAERWFMDSPGPVDCAVLNDVLEHVADPVKMLGDISRILKPDCLIVITTPDIEHPFCWRYQIKPQEHLSYFSQATLKKALNFGGFEVLSCQAVSRWRDLAAALINLTATMSSFDRLIGSFFKVRFLNWFGAGLLKFFVKDEIFVIARKK
jgi:SAM-dependent methyltransferase